MKRIIFSGKGGVGKTTILSNLARLLARDGYRVLVIDCDPSMNLAMSLGIPLLSILVLGCCCNCHDNHAVHLHSLYSSP